MRITLGHILLTFSLCSQTIGDSIEEKNDIYLVAKGDALVLTCTGHFSHMEGKGTRWLRKGNILHQSFPPDWRSDHADSHKRSFDVINGFTHKMTIKHVVEKDVGLYICQTLDSQHNTHYDVAILSQRSITFSEEIKKDNKPIEGTCKISIYHDKELIIKKSQLRFTASVNGLDIAKGHTMYNDIDGKTKELIQNFTFTGRRAYNKKSLNCNVEYSSVKNRTITFAAELDIKYSPREITLKWNKTIMYAGEVIECIADGNPAPILKWNSKASQLYQERDSNTLFIFRNMSGEQSWQCSCSNHHEVEAVQFNFTVASTEGKEYIFEDARSHALSVGLTVVSIICAILMVVILLQIGLLRDKRWPKKKKSLEMSGVNLQLQDDPEIQRPFLLEEDRYSGNTKQEQVLSEKTTALRITTSPQQLMKISSDGKLDLSEDVLSELRTVQGDIVVVAIVGYYRTGKSYLLNQLAGEESPGFKLGSTIEGETKGIWIMVRPHPTKQDTQLVLIDTEGLGDADGKLPRQDAWIYTLAALFSSTLIHNAFGNINEDTIDQWNFVSEMSKKVHIGREYMEDDPDFGMYFPKFILTLRDFTLTLTKGGMEITADEHMESILSQKANRKPEYNEKRTKISRYFPDKKCFLFDRPSEKREELTRLDSIPSGDLSEEFQENVSKFLEFVYKECGPLQLPNGHKMDGAALATLIQHYVKALNQDEGLSIESAVGKVIHEETKMAIENAEKSYRKYMADHVPFPTIDLLTFTNGAKAALDLARKSFVQGIVPGQEGEDLKLFQDKMAAIQKSFDTDNKRLSREKCQAKLDDLNRNMQRKLQNNDYIKLGGYLEFKTDIQDIVDKYRKICHLGIEKEETLSEYLGQLQSYADSILSTDQKMMEIDKKYEAENMRKLADDRLRKRSDKDKEKDHIQRDMEEVNKKMLKDLEEKRKVELEEMHRRFEHVQNERKKHVSRLLKEGLEEQARMLNNFIYEQNKSFTHRREQLDELTTKFKKQQ